MESPSPATPVRPSRPASMASTPISPDDGTSPNQLTPRSKVQAMLASLDRDSDSEADETRDAAAAVRAQLPASKSSVSSRGTQGVFEGTASTSEDEDEDEVGPARPRGSLARRMQSGMDSAPRAETNSEEENKTGTTPATVKRKLLRKPQGPIAPPKNTSKAFVQDDTDSEDEQPSRTPATPQRNPSPEIGALSPLSPALHGNEASDDDLPAVPQKNPRFLELVRKKREELRAKEAEEKRKKNERARRQQSERDELANAASEVDSSDNDRVLTQKARPTRKASKRAIEEMNRETQRMARNMQLAHEARVKRKVTKEDLFAAFDYYPNGKPADKAQEASSPRTSSGSEREHHSTPPTSPAVGEDGHSKKAENATAISADVIQVNTVNTDSSSLLMDPSKLFKAAMDKGKGKATSPPKVEAPKSKTSKRTLSTPTKNRIRQAASVPIGNRSDSDSDLEVVTGKAAKKLAIWDRVSKQKETSSRPLHSLRLLANLASPEKQRAEQKGTMNRTDLSNSLRRRARAQAAAERAERLQQLRDKGIVIQTAEERAEDEAEVEDLLEKARGEADQIKKKETEAAKKAKTAAQMADGAVAVSSDEDADWSGDDEEEAELSGSEEDSLDEDDDADAMNEDSEGKVLGSLIDAEASEDESEAEDVQSDEEADEEEVAALPTRRRRRAQVLSDDEDEAQYQSQKSAPTSAGKPILPGLPLSDPVPLGLTQIFAGTMDDVTQTQAMGESHEEDQDSLKFLRELPQPSLPAFEATMAMESQDVIMDSQAESNQKTAPDSQYLPDINLNYSPSQIEVETPQDVGPVIAATQLSDIPDPTQDAGFARSSPVPERFVEEPPSTVDTVLVTKDDAAEMEVSPVKKKGRLRKRTEFRVYSDDEGENVPIKDVELPTSVFEVMKKSAKPKKAAPEEAFDRKKSKAKGMVEEQAEESEDEYAGIGGASDEESDKEEDEQLAKDLVDDQEQDVDENELAAFYADKDRTNDEKQVQKLFKDITSGMLRKRRGAGAGADFDLSDSDDDGEARRRMKRREFAKMRKALLEDENIEKIASNPKKSAFLAAIEDREASDNDEGDFLDSFDDSPLLPMDHDSQDAAALSQDGLKKRKRDTTEVEGEAEIENRPPPHLRRTRTRATNTKSKSKPASLAEIRESLSALIAEPNALLPPRDGESSSSEDDNDDAPGPKTTNPRRTTSLPTPSGTQQQQVVVDRLSLLRAHSSHSHSSLTNRFAFADPSTSAASGPLGFGPAVPALLRRATTNMTTASNSSTTSTSTSSSVVAMERLADSASASASASSTGLAQTKTIKAGGAARSSAINAFSASAVGKRRVEREERRRGREMGRRGRERGGVLGGLLGQGGGFL